MLNADADLEHQISTLKVDVCRLSHNPIPNFELFRSMFRYGFSDGRI